MDGLIPLTFKPEDLQCLFFRYIGRELLASAVMRPVFNLASPKYKIASLLASLFSVLLCVSAFIFFSSISLFADLLMKELKT